MSKNCANKVQVTSSVLDKLRIFQCSYKWVISSFSMEKKKMRTVTAPFTVDDCFGTKFSFWLDGLQPNPVCWYIYLVRENDISGRNERFLFNTEFSVLDSNDVRRFVTSSGISSSSVGSTFLMQYLTSRQTLLKDPELLPNDTLTILCDFQLVKALEDLDPVPTPNSLYHDMKSLYEHRNNADVMLQVGDEVVKTHKLVLITRSSVFAAMFENEMKESRDNKVNIPDITKDVLEELLSYMYTDETPNLKTTALGLLGAAEKYHVESLKGRCEKHLLETVTVEDAAEILINADLYNAEGLKKGVIRFINSNKKAFVKTEGWKILRQSYGRLVSEIFEADASN